MIGAPPVAGFISKWYLLIGAIDARSLLIIGVLIVSTLLNAAYFAPVVYHGFFGKAAPTDAQHRYREAPLTMVIPLSLTAFISVLIGVYPDFFMNFAKQLFP
jgi:multicomponent Na+:H+ antiporter subunit D